MERVPHNPYGSRGSHMFPGAGVGATVNTAHPSFAGGYLERALGYEQRTEDEFPEEDVDPLAGRILQRQVPTATGQINTLTYNLMTSAMIDRVSVIEIKNKSDLENPAMGPTGRGVTCTECGGGWTECPGHYGRIVIPRIVHPLMDRIALKCLQSVCYDCSSILVTEEYYRVRGWDKLEGIDRLNEISKYCDQAAQTTRRDVQHNRHNCRQPLRYRSEDPSKPSLYFKSFVGKGKNRGGNQSGGQSNVDPERVYDILSNISNEHARMLGFDVDRGQMPGDLVIDRVVVVPNPTRVSPVINGRKRINDLTTQYGVILDKLAEYNRTPSRKVEVFNAVYALFKGDSSRSGKHTRSITDMLDGKEGAVRGISQGKRVGNVARGVAAPFSAFDPAGDNGKTLLRVDQVGMPRHMAISQGREIVVQQYNRSRLQIDYDMGLVTHITPKDGFLAGRRHRVTSDFRQRYSRLRLRNGDVVVRQIKDGDTVIIHRNPTLETGNFVALKAKIIDGDAIMPSVSVTTPMNLDFDGDEIQVHVVNGADAYAEASSIMSVQGSMISYSTGNAVIALVYDALTGSYTLTRDPEMRIDKRVYDFVIEPLLGSKKLRTLDARLSRHGVDKYSGHGLFSACLPPGLEYFKNGLVVRDGVLVSGTLTKSSTGTTGNGLVKEIVMQLGPQEATDFISDARIIANRWLQVNGFTVNISDCAPLEGGGGLSKDKQKEIDDKKSVLIKSTNDAVLSLKKNPSTENREIIERLILAYMTNYRGAEDGILKEEVERGSNNIMTTVAAGSKGSMYNILSMVGSLGQQLLEGKRIPADLPGGRTLVCFPFRPKDEEAGIEERGYCFSSFGDGLTPREFFFHMISTRESLIIGSMDTPKTGDIERRAVKACEDVTVDERSCTSAGGRVIIQPVFGYNAMDPRNSQVVKGVRLPRDLGHLAKIITTKYSRGV